MKDIDMTSSQPYLVRAMYEWITDNGLTPYVLVNANVSEVQIPKEYIENGKIILNISDRAISDFIQDNEWMQFSARFRGKKMNVCIPIEAIMAIYARENGKGMVLDHESGRAASAEQSVPKTERKTGKPHLQLVK